MIKRLRLWIRNIFGFSQAETNGFLILLPLILAILFSQPIYQWLADDTHLEFDEHQAHLDSLMANWDFNPEVPNEEINIFEFDPNIISKQEFDSLGFPPYLSLRIINYRSKGGRFRKPEDLLKIYGIDSSFFDKIQPFIRIEKVEPVEEAFKNKMKTSEKNQVIVSPFDLNEADTIQLKSIRGIGPVLASRIVKYRDALGGFFMQSQIKEVYGLDSGVVKLLINRSFVDPSFVPKQININTATEQDLSHHPYINSKLARTIVAYRFQHGSFKEINDLLKIDLIENHLFSRIAPYLKIEP